MIPQVVSLVVNRSDVFPVGVSVSAYPAAARHDFIHAVGTATETKTVQNDGSLTFVELDETSPYVLYAEVAGKDKYIQVRNQAFSEPPLGLIERINAFRLANGVE